MTEETHDPIAPEPGANAPSVADHQAIHDAAPTPSPVPPPPSTPPAPVDEAKQQAIVESQQVVDSSADALTKFKAQQAADLVREEAAHQELVDAHTRLTAVQYHPSTTIGIDHGATGAYSYIDAPEGHDVAKQRSYLIGGSNYEHVAEDASGVWLYRRM